VQGVQSSIFPDIKLNSLPKEQIPDLHERCLKKITELSPDLKNKIITGLKKNTVEELILDVPF